MYCQAELIWGIMETWWHWHSKSEQELQMRSPNVSVVCRWYLTCLAFGSRNASADSRRIQLEFAEHFLLHAFQYTYHAYRQDFNVGWGWWKACPRLPLYPFYAPCKLDAEVFFWIQCVCMLQCNRNSQQAYRRWEARRCRAAAALVVHYYFVACLSAWVV